jgi:hypothetical protein
MELRKRIPEKRVENYCFLGYDSLHFGKRVNIYQSNLQSHRRENLKSRKETVGYFGTLKVCLYGICVTYQNQEHGKKNGKLSEWYFVVKNK